MSGNEWQCVAMSGTEWRTYRDGARGEEADVLLAEEGRAPGESTVQSNVSEQPIRGMPQKAGVRSTRPAAHRAELRIPFRSAEEKPKAKLKGTSSHARGSSR